MAAPQTKPQASAAVPKQAEAQFQKYNSVRASTKMFTTAGKPIVFVGGQHVTKDKDVIEYLDAEIEAGLRVVSKGEKMTSQEADPMEALKRKIIAEHEEKKAEAAKLVAEGKLPDMGKTLGASNLGASSSADVASGSSNSR